MRFCFYDISYLSFLVMWDIKILRKNEVYTLSNDPSILRLYIYQVNVTIMLQVHVVATVTLSDR